MNTVGCRGSRHRSALGAQVTRLASLLVSVTAAESAVMDTRTPVLPTKAPTYGRRRHRDSGLRDFRIPGSLGSRGARGAARERLLQGASQCLVLQAAGGEAVPGASETPSAARGTTALPTAAR